MQSRYWSLSKVSRVGVSCLLLVVAWMASMPRFGLAQGSDIRYGSKVPADVEVIYQRGLRYLAQSQAKDGSWPGQGGRAGSGNNGITGLCVMAFLASGEDPNFGRYSLNIRRGVRALVLGQDPTTGYLGSSMYHHGFATLSLAEAYGAVDESLLWDGSEPAGRKRSLGQALELAVRCAITSQKNNQWGGWRYSPSDRNADTSVSGAVLVGLLAARNAGIEVPDEVIDKGLNYFKTSTSDTGIVAYSGGVGGFGESMNRSSIATLVFSVGKRKDWKEYKSALGYISGRLEHSEQGYPFYNRYYMAQALFQGDFESWQKWNSHTSEVLRNLQSDDGSFNSSHGAPYATAMSLLALALNYRFLPIYER